MKLSRTIKVALHAITSNKMRSFLTMLGIIIGVMAVTMLVSLGQGAQSEITGQLSDLGSNLLVVSVTSPRSFDITMENVQALAGEGGIGHAAPVVTHSATLSAEGNNDTYTVTGTTPDYLSIRSMALASGTGFSALDVDTRSNAAVLGVNVARDLFGTEQAVGNRLKVDGKEFVVSGVLEEKGSSIMGSQDDAVLIPLTTAQRMFKQTRIASLYIAAVDDASVSAAEQQANTFLMSKTGDADAYSVLNQAELVKMVGDVTGIMTSLLAGIAAISLLVGGIGIMNIMLVSVSERTREIGIRKAIGAPKSSIITQFLLEAIFISVLGGIIGLGIGAAGMSLFSRLMDMSMGLTAAVAALALGFSVGIGVLFGIFPANKASNLEPIEALRYQ